MGVECFTDRCSSCGGVDVVTDFSAGDIVCRDCGLILGERIVDDSPEWRTFANDDRGGDPAAKSRVGAASDARLDQVSLASYLVNVHKSTAAESSSGAASGAGSNAPANKRPSLKHDSLRVTRMQDMMDKIHSIGDSMALPKSVVERALDVYAAAEKLGIVMRGPEKDSIAAATIFIACRQSGNSRSLKEMEAATGASKKAIGKTFMMLSKRLKVEMTQATTEDYVHRFCSRLGLPNRTKMIANDVAKKADTLGLSTGKSPVAVAASVVYLVAAFTDAKRSLQEVSDVSMIGEKNVKVVCKELNKSRVVLFEGVLLG